MTAMPRSEREDLQRLVRQREKALKSNAKLRSKDGACQSRHVVEHAQPDPLGSYLIELLVLKSLAAILEVPARRVAMLRIERQSVDCRG